MTNYNKLLTGLDCSHLGLYLFSYVPDNRKYLKGDAAYCIRFYDYAYTAPVKKEYSPLILS